MVKGDCVIIIANHLVTEIQPTENFLSSSSLASWRLAHRTRVTASWAAESFAVADITEITGLTTEEIEGL